MITKHVLLIEDDHDDQEVFSMALREIDSAIICHTVDDALEGIDKLKQDPQFVPDMIFIDLNMPKMDGIGCVRELRTLPQIAGVPIFMYSTRNDARRQV